MKTRPGVRGGFRGLFGKSGHVARRECLSPHVSRLRIERLEDRHLLTAAAIDQHLLDLIEQHAELYYNSTWNVGIDQYKAWIATIAWAEGGEGGYSAHSQGALGSDNFYHTARSEFTFSTGIGPFQLDRGGGSEAWGLWPTIRKLEPNESVISGRPKTTSIISGNRV